MKYLSFGAGVQTTAILLMYPQIKFDEVIFADTGSELPETYEYLEKYSKPFMEENGIKFTVVRANDKGINSLEEYCLHYKLIPSMQIRWCTDKFKTKPIEKYLLSKPKEDFPITGIFGISYDEAHRVKKPRYEWWLLEYPLVELKMTRQDCIKVIEKKGYPIPPKSGCFFCPFRTKKQWEELYIKHPDLYERAIRLEENSRDFEKFKLLPSKKSLRELREEFGYGNHKLDEYD